MASTVNYKCNIISTTLGTHLIMLISKMTKTKYSKTCFNLHYIKEEIKYTKHAKFMVLTLIHNRLIKCIKKYINKDTY